MRAKEREKPRLRSKFLVEEAGESHHRAFALTVLSAHSALSPHSCWAHSVNTFRSLLKCCPIRESSSTRYKMTPNRSPNPHPHSCLPILLSSILVHSTPHRLTFYVFICSIAFLSPWEWELQESSSFFLFCSLFYPQYLT